MSDAPKKPEPPMKLTAMRWVTRAELEEIYPGEDAERRWERGPVRINKVPVVMPDGHEPMESDDEGRTGSSTV